MNLEVLETSKLSKRVETYYDLLTLRVLFTLLSIFSWHICFPVVTPVICKAILVCDSLKENELAFPNLVKSRGHEMNAKSSWIALKFYMWLCGTAPKTPVKFESHLVILKTNLATTRLEEI